MERIQAVTESDTVFYPVGSGKFGFKRIDLRPQDIVAAL